MTILSFNESTWSKINQLIHPKFKPLLDYKAQQWAQVLKHQSHAAQRDAIKRLLKEVPLTSVRRLCAVLAFLKQVGKLLEEESSFLKRVHQVLVRKECVRYVMYSQELRRLPDSSTS